MGFIAGSIISVYRCENNNRGPGALRLALFGSISAKNEQLIVQRALSHAISRLDSRLSALATMIPLLFLAMWGTCAMMTAYHSTTGSADSAVDESLYALSREEIRAFLAKKRSNDPSNIPFNASLMPRKKPPPFEPPAHNPNLDVSGLVDTQADCMSHNINELGHKLVYALVDAECEEPGESPFYWVQCKSSQMSETRSGKLRPYGEPGLEKFFHSCPEPKVCMPYHLKDFLGEPKLVAGEYKDVQCVFKDALVIENVEAVAGSSHQQCSPSHEIPGGYLPASYTGVDLILSEEVSWANGSAYKAPAMFIVDETSGKSYDRAYEMNTDIVSTELTIQTYRGHLQNRIIKFCFEQISGGRAWTVMLYSWFRMSPKRARLPRKVDSDE